MLGVIEWVRRRFPEAAWHDAEQAHGAFHDVVIGGDAVARVATDQDPARTVAERAVWDVWQQVDVPVAVPRLLSDVRSAEGRHGYLIGRLPGRLVDDAPWESVRNLMAELLEALRGAEVSGLRLPPVRTWCGGEHFPEVVREELAPRLARGDARVAAHAVDAVDRMLALDRSGPPTLVHGDLGPHNLLWDGSLERPGRLTGLIDLDHACVADQVVDLAPLVGFYGAAAVREIAASAHVERAVTYRATLSLQVAAAAHLRGATSLRDHALGNVARRVR